MMKLAFYILETNSRLFMETSWLRRRKKDKLRALGELLNGNGESIEQEDT